MKGPPLGVTQISHRYSMSSTYGGNSLPQNVSPVEKSPKSLQVARRGFWRMGYTDSSGPKRRMSRSGNNTGRSTRSCRSMGNHKPLSGSPREEHVIVGSGGIHVQ